MLTVEHLDRIPRDPAYAAAADFENLCKAMTVTEIRDAAMICAELAAAVHGFANSCEATATAVAALHLTTSADLAPVLRGVEAQNARWTERLVRDADTNHRAAMANLRAAGALLWLAEQREVGAP